ncbi:MAG: HIT family protein [Candidatus Brocadiae bacterium]|nr:HIT family protein [Candidatus Brocadiia bacterium]
MASCTFCPHLGRRDGFFVVDWPYHIWRLADDQTWPGWSLLVLKRHVTELFELEREERAAVIEEVSAAARILKDTMQATKINIELLGNKEPHLHWHIVPRRTDDPAWNQPIWAHAHPPRTLSPRDHDALISRIRRALPSGPRP